MIEQIQAFHAAYVQATGIDIRLAFDRERAWYDFIQAGFTDHDLRIVACWLIRKIKTGDRNPGALKFSNLIERLDRFEEELALCKAEMRNFKAPPREKEKVIRAFRPEASELPAKSTAKPAAEVILGAIEELRKAVL